MPTLTCNEHCQPSSCVRLCVPAHRHVGENMMWWIVMGGQRKGLECRSFIGNLLSAIHPSQRHFGVKCCLLFHCFASSEADRKTPLELDPLLRIRSVRTFVGMGYGKKKFLSLCRCAIRQVIITPSPRVALYGYLTLHPDVIHN